MTQVTAFCVDDEAREYLSNLLTLELCKEFHERDKPNTAIRKCCARLIERTQGARCKAVMAGLMAQPMPAGSLAPVAPSAARDGWWRGCMGELEWPDDDAIAHVINGGE